MKNFAISKLIAIAFTIVVIASISLSLLLYLQLNKTTATLDRVLQVEEPASAAAYEMEINAVGSVLAAIKYQENQKPEYRQRLAKDAADFAKFYAIHQKLLSDKNAISSGNQANQLYLQLKMLALSMMDKRDAYEVLANQYANLTKNIEYLIEKSLLSSTQVVNGQKPEKHLLLYKLDGSLHGISDALAGFLQTYKPAYQKIADNYAAEFEAALARYRLLNISPAQRKTSFDVERQFNQALQIKSEMMLASEKLAEQESALIALRVNIDDVLDDDIQRLAVARLENAKAESYKVVNKAKLSIMLMLPVVMLISICTGLLLLRMVKQAIQSFINSADKISAGDLDYRMPFKGDNEFTQLATQFNQMAENLQKTTVTKEQYKTSEQLLKFSNASLLDKVNKLDQQQQV